MYFAILLGMNRQLIFIIGLILFILPWPQIGLPQIMKLVIIDVCAVLLLVQAMRKPRK